MLLPLGTEHGRRHPAGRSRGCRARPTSPETAEQPGKILHELRRAAARARARASRCRRSTTAPSTRPRSGSACSPTPARRRPARRRGARAAAAPRGGAGLDARRRRQRRRRPARVRRRDRPRPVEPGLEGLAATRCSGATGELADGPIALCEVQAYAYEAAMRGADAARRASAATGGDEWRAWATRLARPLPRDASGSTTPDGALPGDRARRREAPGRHRHQQHRPPARHRPPRRRRGGAASRGCWSRPSSTRASACAPCRPTPPATGRSGTTAAASGPTTPRSPSPGSPATGFAAEAAPLSRRAAAAPRSRSTTGCPSCTPATPPPVPAAPAPYPAACRPQAWCAAAAVAVWAASRRSSPQTQEFPATNACAWAASPRGLGGTDTPAALLDRLRTRPTRRNRSFRGSRQVSRAAG